MTPETSLSTFVEALGSSAPTPGGGAAAALAGALAAALTEMVAQLTVGKPRYASVEGIARETVTRAQALRSDLLALIEQDATAFQGVSAAYRLPKSSDDEREQREHAIQSALAGAMQPPFLIMERALDVLRLAREMARTGNQTVASDAACAAILGDAAVRAGALNVLANVVLLHDQAQAGAARARSAALERAAAAESAHTLADVRGRMGV